MSDYRGIYHKKYIEKGSIYTRNQRNIVEPATTSLAVIYDNFIKAAEYLYNVDVTSQLLSGIKDFEIWFDTIMVCTDSFLFLTKIDFDYETNTIKNILDDIHVINLDKTIFGDTWFFPENKKVTICTLVSCSNTVLYPVLRSYNIEDNTINFLYNKSDETTDFVQWQYNSCEPPVLTYNHKTKTYNVAFITYSTLEQYNSGSFSGMFTNLINIQDTGNIYSITKIETVIPVILGD